MTLAIHGRLTGQLHASRNSVWVQYDILRAKPGESDAKRHCSPVTLSGFDLNFPSSARSGTDDARVERDVFVLQKFVDPRLTVETAVSASLESALFELDQRDTPIVNPDGAGFDLSCNAQRSIDIPRPDTRCESVFAVVCQPNGVLFRVENHHCENGAKDFLLHDGRVRVCDFKQRWSVEGILTVALVLSQQFLARIQKQSIFPAYPFLYFC